MDRPPTRRVAPFAALILLLAACSGDDDDASDSTSAPTAEEAATASTEAGAETSVSEDSAPAGSVPEATGDGATYSADEYVDAVVVAIGADDEETSSCIAQSVVDAIGVERLEASGLAPQEFAEAPALSDVDLAIDESQAPAMQADLEACGDLIGLFASTGDATPEQIECVRENLTNSVIAQVFVTQFVLVPPSAEVEAATAAAQECAAE